MGRDVSTDGADERRSPSRASAPPAIGDLARDQGIALHELTPQEASLEEAYMELTQPYHHDRAASSEPPRSRRVTVPPVLRSEWTKLRSLRSTWYSLSPASSS